MPKNVKQAGTALIFSLLLFLYCSGDTFCRIDLFAAPLVCLLYTLPCTLCLWIVLFCGLLKDALMSSSRLGIIALSYLLAALVVHRGRYLLFKDWIGTLPLMTALFSLIATLVQCVASLFFSSEQVICSFGWVITDCIILPFVDGLYAFILFGLLPIVFKRYMKKKAVA